MNADLVDLYEKYAAYVGRLHEELDRAVGQWLPAESRTALLDQSDFLQVWDRWGETAGLQEFWRSRFEQGYDAGAAAFRDRLVAALAPVDNTSPSLVARRAA